ncbi:MAG TPA: long-chain fatty acid--CoA ligase [Bacteroidota bacterium]|nr:long-chain fatty acid--CoA ligase [Bacteroidota bacterium]
MSVTIPSLGSGETFFNQKIFFGTVGSAVEFSTIIEMFDKVTCRFQHESRPLLMHKVEGIYKGISFRNVRSTVERFALGLSGIGVKKGDMVGLISENRPEWVVADMGMMCLGAINVPLYPTFTPKQIEYIFNDAGVKFAVVSNQMQLNKLLKIAAEVPSLQGIIVMNDKGTAEDSRVRKFSAVIKMGEAQHKDERSPLLEAAFKTQPQDLLTLIYTSGTTGNPKGVMLSHDNLVSNIMGALECLPFSHDDTLLSFLPLCHSFERMGGYYTAVSCGATIAYAESIDTVRENLAEIRPTILTGVPRFYERIYNRIHKQVDAETPLNRRVFYWAVNTGRKYARAKREGRTLPQLSIQRSIAERLVFRKLKERTGGKVRFLVSGGAALPREYGEFFEAIGLQVIEGYGLTESSPVISVNRLDDYKFGTVGKPIARVEVKIAPDGEILARGPNIMQGYWNDEAATREAIDEDRWLHTGDIGMFDEEGFLHITDRKKHLFVTSGGKNIAPQPIESHFLQSKYIDQFVLIGDGRLYLTALIVPDFDVLKDFAKLNHVPLSARQELIEKPDVIKLFDLEINLLQQDLPSYERVRKFTLLSNPFTIEEGELTPTLKVRRKVINEKYKDIIDRMYGGLK